MKCPLPTGVPNLIGYQGGDAGAIFMPENMHSQRKVEADDEERNISEVSVKAPVFGLV